MSEIKIIEAENKNIDVSMHPRKAKINEFNRIIHVMVGRPIVLGSGILVLMSIFVALAAPLLSPYEPDNMDFSAVLQPPTPSHLLGTDDLGRDTLSRLIYGARISLLVGVVSVFVAGGLGMTLGLIAGYIGGWTETIVMRFMDALLAIPPLILMLTIAAMLGQGLTNVVIALGIGMLPTYCRLMAGQIISIKHNDYVAASQVIGCGDVRIMVRHLIPNSFPPLLVLLTTNIGMAILIEASLSYLGIGVSPPTATWGNMVNDGYKYLIDYPLLSFAPGIALLLVVLSFNMVGDGLRDALDPRLRGRF